MKFVIQRSRSASVTVNGAVTGSIDKGFVVLIGVCDSDDEQTADRLIRKMLGLRIFEDGQGKTNISLRDAGGSLLLISQFTLYADCRRGNRPSFIKAGDPAKAERLYEYIIGKCRMELESWNKEKAAAGCGMSPYAYIPGSKAEKGCTAGKPDPAGSCADLPESTSAKENAFLPFYKVSTGVFGADMQVSLINDGPFTIILDSDEMQGKS